MSIDNGDAAVPPAEPGSLDDGAGNVSRNCHTGNHKRCLGTTFVYPPSGGRHIVPCDCPVTACGHGPEKPRD